MASKSRKMYLVLSAMVGLIISLASATLADNLITNGSFESPVCGNDSQQIPAGWTWSGGDIKAIMTHECAWRPAAADGTQYVMMCLSSEYQTISETAQTGHTYTLTADYGRASSNNCPHFFKLEAVNPSDSNDVVILVDGSGLADSTKWSTFSATSAVLSADYNGWNLRVTIGTTAYWASFDNVQLTTAVPEPASMVLVGVGGLGLLLRRKYSRF